MTRHHPPSRQQVSRGAARADWTAVPAMLYRNTVYTMTERPQVRGDVLYITVAPTAEGPRILAATPIIDLHVLTFEDLPAEIAAALRSGSR
jgi:hypothetical protein